MLMCEHVTHIVYMCVCMFACIHVQGHQHSCVHACTCCVCAWMSRIAVRLCTVLSKADLALQLPTFFPGS